MTRELKPADQEALDALRQAVAEALERKRRLGQYAVTWNEGKPWCAVPEAPLEPVALPEDDTPR